MTRCYGTEVTNTPLPGKGLALQTEEKVLEWGLPPGDEQLWWFTQTYLGKTKVF